MRMMSSELIINTRPHETRVALLENSVVVELFIERKTGQELIGNIYRGRIVRVLPGMQAAFVDIGQDRSAFLYVSDVHRDIMAYDQIMLGNQDINEEADYVNSLSTSFPRMDHIPLHIEDLLFEGQSIMVQVAKEPLGNKGARLTSHISLPGRHLVLMPTVNHIGISRRIEDKQERDRLRGIMEEINQFIYNTISGFYGVYTNDDMVKGLEAMVSPPFRSCLYNKTCSSSQRFLSTSGN